MKRSRHIYRIAGLTPQTLIAILAAELMYWHVEGHVINPDRIFVFADSTRQDTRPHHIRDSPCRQGKHYLNTDSQFTACTTSLFVAIGLIGGTGCIYEPNAYLFRKSKRKTPSDGLRAMR